MKCVLIAVAIYGGVAAEARLRRGPVTEIRQEMRLRKAWSGDIADADPWKDQKRASREKAPGPDPYKGVLPWDDDKGEDAATSMNVDILDSLEKASPFGGAAQHAPDDVRKQKSVRSEERQRFDADPKNTAPMFEVSEREVAKNEPDFYDQVFGKPPEQQRIGAVDRQLWDLAGAKAGHWGTKEDDFMPKTPEKIVAWKPDVDARSMALVQRDDPKGLITEALVQRDDPEDDEEEDPTGGAANFVAPCPLTSVAHPEVCQTFITGQHPAVPKPVACPAIQKACGKGSGSGMMSLVCNGSCCPVCTAPDHVIAIDRHTSIKNPDVIPPHPSAPASCAGVKCFTPLCLPGYEAGHSPGACCSSCRMAR